MNPPPDLIVLVHGLWTHGALMRPLARRLRAHGFATCELSYPTVRCGLADNAAELGHFIACCRHKRVHLLGHSLGGLVILKMLASTPDPRIARTVLLGTPCTGSHAARGLLRTRFLAPLVGRSLSDALAAGPPEAPAGRPVGVIAGDRSCGLGRLIPGLPQPNDGAVTVAETALPGAADRLVLPVAHTQMLFSAACADRAAAFFRSGQFGDV